jgi:septum formation protein
MSGAGRPALVLGSSSPRRKELLSVLGLTFEVLKPETEETPRPGETPVAYVRRNADEKGAWIAARLAATPARYPHGAVVVSADTIVVLGDDILEKPLSTGHAADMLRRLSGQTHTVVSGVSLRTAVQAVPRAVTFTVRTQVKIKDLSDREIQSYIRTGEPMDKAGAYAAQGIGSYMVERIDGSYSNVVGLPIAEVVQALERDFAFPLFADEGRA